MLQIELYSMHEKEKKIQASKQNIVALLVNSFSCFNTIRNADETFSFLACRRQRPQMRNFCS